MPASVPTVRPSTKKGTLIKRFVAPTKRMMDISRLRMSTLALVVLEIITKLTMISAAIIMIDTTVIIALRPVSTFTKS